MQTTNDLSKKIGGGRKFKVTSTSVNLNQYLGGVRLRTPNVLVHTDRLYSECPDSADAIIAPLMGMNSDSARGRVVPVFDEFSQELTAEQEYTRDFHDRMQTRYNAFLREY